MPKRSAASMRTWSSSHPHDRTPPFTCMWQSIFFTMALLRVLEGTSPLPAVAVQKLAIDPAALGRAQKAHEMGAVLRQAHPPSGGLPGDFGHLAGGHPTRIGRAWIHNVRSDARVAKF